MAGKNNISKVSRAGTDTSRLNWLNKICKSLLINKLGRLTQCELELIDGKERFVFGKGCGEINKVELNIKDPRFYRSLVLKGNIGAADSYILGYWECNDLVGLIRIILRNRHVMVTMESGASLLLKPFRRLGHLMRRNTISGSRRNIAAHYDLSNDFYALFLDRTMAYSSAVFPSKKSSLEMASLEKFDRICRKLDLKPDDHLLEIGTGWGGFAIYASKNYGCKVTTTTISTQQYNYASEAVREEGLDDEINILKRDYRELDGKFDKLASIEMIEAVGYELIPVFLANCSRLLKDNGLMLIQAITLTDRYFDSYHRGVDFIQEYIFPGACLVSISHLLANLKKHTDLRVVNLEDITGHYAHTLRLWRERFFKNLEEIKKLGFSDAFIKMWEFYLCYCEGGFRERHIGDVQLLLAKPSFLEEHYLPK